MARERRNYTDEFKKQIVELYNNGKSRAELVREYELTPSALSSWIIKFNSTGSFKAEDNRIYLIDWEYSGVNDPMADFAALFLESEFSEENQDYMMKQYFQGETPANTWNKILCYQILWDYLWSQWTVIKEANGDDFGTYGIDRFNRAKTNLLKI